MTMPGVTMLGFFKGILDMQVINILIVMLVFYLKVYHYFSFNVLFRSSNCLEIASGNLSFVSKLGSTSPRLLIVT